MKGFVSFIGLFLLLTVIAGAEIVDHPWDIFEPVESMLKRSDAIVLGVVKDSYTIQESNQVLRYTTIDLEKVVYSKLQHLDNSITIVTKEGFLKNGELKELLHIPPRFPSGQLMMALITNDNGGKYKLLSDAYGKFDINDNAVEKCGTPLEVFVNEIKKVVSGQSKKFDVNYPSYYMQQRTRRKNFKTAHSGLHSGTAEFRCYEYYCFTSQPHAIEFHINPTGAKDGYGDPISFATLYSIISDAVEEWNALDDTNIQFTVDDEPTDETRDEGDGFSVISFEDIPYSALSMYPLESPRESDITFKNANWALPGQGWPDYSGLFYRTIVHELGHSVGLGDLGAESPYYDDPELYNDNLMWHTGQYMQWSIETPQDGDKAGAVYLVPDLEGTMEFNEIWSGFAGSYKPLVVSSNVTIPEGITLEIEAGDEVHFASNVNINVYGTLKIGAGAKLTHASGGTFWGGINLYTTGSMTVNGDITIE